MKEKQARDKQNREIQAEADRKHAQRDLEYHQRDLRQMELNQQKRNEENPGNPSFLLGHRVRTDDFDADERARQRNKELQHQNDLREQVRFYIFKNLTVGKSSI